MSQGAYVTVVGFVAQDPHQHETKAGRVTKMRIGSTPRFQDRATQEWRDAETSYYDVTCWRRLGDHVKASMRKGDPVFIKGRLQARSYQDKTGQPRNVIDIQADTVGHDLSRRRRRRRATRRRNGRRWPRRPRLWPESQAG
jgi:single-strand DNA-binding protein